MHDTLGRLGRSRGNFLDALESVKDALKSVWNGLESVRDCLENVQDTLGSTLDALECSQSEIVLPTANKRLQYSPWDDEGTQT